MSSPKKLFGLILVLCAIFQASVSVVQAADLNAISSEFLPGQLLVGYRRPTHIQGLLDVEGVQAILWNSNLEKLGTVLLSVNPGEELAIAENLLLLPGIRFAEPNYLVEPALAPSDALWPQQYGPAQIGAPAAWDITTGSADTVLAIIDSGIDLGHPEFAGRILPGYDFIDRDKTPNDQCGHGTHVAGIAAAAGDNAQGIAGIAWNVKIMPLKVLAGPNSPFGPCGGTTASVADALIWAADRNVDIINLSIGTSAPSALMQNATYYAYQKGVALFAAAGNAGTSPVFYPAAYPWVMAVGATNVLEERASYSNFGAGLDIMAPGSDILSTTPRGYFYYSDPASYGLSHNYDFLSGTSMAAPFVSGSAALLASLPGYDTPDRIYEGITTTAADMEAVGMDANTGYGLLQLDAAMAYLPTSPPVTIALPSTQYDILDSRICANLVSYFWRDATQGTVLPIFGSNGSHTVALPFTFTYAEVDYAEVTVSANGYLTFGGSGGESENFLIPGIAQPNNFIAPFWDNLNPSAGGLIYATTNGVAPEREFVVQWNNVPRQGVGGFLDFEVILHEDSGEITFQYKTLRGNGAEGESATIGLEFADGHGGSEYSYNQKKAIGERTAIRFVPYINIPIPSEDCMAASTQNDNRVALQEGETLLETVVTSEGGTFKLAPFCVNIPAGLVEKDSILRIRLLNTGPNLPMEWQNLGQFIDVEIDPKPDFSRGSPILCYQLNTETLLANGGHGENLFFAHFLPGDKSWSYLASSVDKIGTNVFASTPHFSLFGVFSVKPGQLPTTGATVTPSLTRWLPILLLVPIAFGIPKRFLSLRVPILNVTGLAALLGTLLLLFLGLPLFTANAQENNQRLPDPQIVSPSIAAGSSSVLSYLKPDEPKKDLLSLATIEYGDRLIERISIPKLNIASDVLPLGWQANRSLKDILKTEWDSPQGVVGWVVTSALPGDSGNVILYGHNNIYDAVFRNLADLSEGDVIHLVSSGGLKTYSVSEVHLLPMLTDVQQSQAYSQFLQPTDEPVLTIISCWPYISNTHRVVIRALPTE
ncbi:MAG: S8 family serine peptidase [Anaerolineales bacterium]|nr:S8 family serine peptidase [Anaerolineales bacterium]